MADQRLIIDVQADVENYREGISKAKRITEEYVDFNKKSNKELSDYEKRTVGDTVVGIEKKRKEALKNIEQHYQKARKLAKGNKNKLEELEEQYQKKRFIINDQADKKLISKRKEFVRESNKIFEDSSILGLKKTLRKRLELLKQQQKRELALAGKNAQKQASIREAHAEQRSQIKLGAGRAQAGKLKSLAGKGGMIGIGIAAAAKGISVFKGLAKESDRFSRSLLNAKNNMPEEEFIKLESTLKRMSISSEMTREELGEMASKIATFEAPEEVAKTTKMVVDLQRGLGDVDTETTIGQLGRFSESLNDTALAGDIFATAINDIGGNIENNEKVLTEIPTVFSKATIVIEDQAKAAKESAAIWAKLTKVMEPGEATSTAEEIFLGINETLTDPALRAAMVKTLPDGITEMEAGLEKGNISAVKLIETIEKFPEEGKRLASLLPSTAGEGLQILQAQFNKTGESITETASKFNDVSGAVKQMGKEMSTRSQRISERFTAAWDSIKLSVGGAGKSILADVTEFGAGLLEGVADWFKPAAIELAEIEERARKFDTTARGLEGTIQGFGNAFGSLNDKTKLTKEQLDTAFEKVGVEAGKLKEDMPFISAEMQRIIDNPNQRTVEGLQKLVGLMKEAKNISEGLATAEIAEAADKSVEALDDSLEGSAERIQGHIGNVMDSLGDGFSDLRSEMSEFQVGSTFFASDEIFEIIDVTKRGLDEAIDKQKRLRQEGSLEEQKEASKKLLELNRARQDLALSQTEAESNIKDAIQKQLETAARLQGVSVSELDLSMQKDLITGSLIENLDAEEKTAAKIREIFDNQTSSLVEQAAKAEEARQTEIERSNINTQLSIAKDMIASKEEEVVVSGFKMLANLGQQADINRDILSTEASKLGIEKDLVQAQIVQVKKQLENVAGVDEELQKRLENLQAKEDELLLQEADNEAQRFKNALTLEETDIQTLVNDLLAQKLEGQDASVEKQIEILQGLKAENDARIQVVESAIAGLKAVIKGEAIHGQVLNDVLKVQNQINKAKGVSTEGTEISVDSAQQLLGQMQAELDNLRATGGEITKQISVLEKRQKVEDFRKRMGIRDSKGRPTGVRSKEIDKAAKEAEKREKEQLEAAKKIAAEREKLQKKLADIEKERVELEQEFEEKRKDAENEAIKARIEEAYEIERAAMQRAEEERKFKKELIDFRRGLMEKAFDLRQESIEALEGIITKYINSTTELEEQIRSIGSNAQKAQEQANLDISRRSAELADQNKLLNERERALIEAEEKARQAENERKRIENEIRIKEKQKAEAELNAKAEEAKATAAATEKAIREGLEKAFKERGLQAAKDIDINKINQFLDKIPQLVDKAEKQWVEGIDKINKKLKDVASNIQISGNQIIDTTDRTVLATFKDFNQFKEKFKEVITNISQASGSARADAEAARKEIMGRSGGGVQTGSSAQVASQLGISINQLNRDLEIANTKSKNLDEITKELNNKYNELKTSISQSRMELENMKFAAGAIEELDLSSLHRAGKTMDIINEKLKNQMDTFKEALKSENIEEARRIFTEGLNIIEKEEVDKILGGVKDILDEGFLEELASKYKNRIEELNKAINKSQGIRRQALEEERDGMVEDLNMLTSKIIPGLSLIQEETSKTFEAAKELFPEREYLEIITELNRIERLNEESNNRIKELLQTGRERLNKMKLVLMIAREQGRITEAEEKELLAGAKLSENLDKFQTLYQDLLNFERERQEGKEKSLKEVLKSIDEQFEADKKLIIETVKDEKKREKLIQLLEERRSEEKREARETDTEEKRKNLEKQADDFIQFVQTFEKMVGFVENTIKDITEISSEFIEGDVGEGIQKVGATTKEIGEALMSFNNPTVKKIGAAFLAVGIVTEVIGKLISLGGREKTATEISQERANTQKKILDIYNAQIEAVETLKGLNEAMADTAREELKLRQDEFEIFLEKNKEAGKMNEKSNEELTNTKKALQENVAVAQELADNYDLLFDEVWDEDEREKFAEDVKDLGLSFEETSNSIKTGERAYQELIAFIQNTEGRIEDIGTILGFREFEEQILPNIFDELRNIESFAMDIFEGIQDTLKDWFKDGGGFTSIINMINAEKQAIEKLKGAMQGLVDLARLELVGALEKAGLNTEELGDNAADAQMFFAEILDDEELRGKLNDDILEFAKKYINTLEEQEEFLESLNKTQEENTELEDKRRKFAHERARIERDFALELITEEERQDRLTELLERQLDFEKSNLEALIAQGITGAELMDQKEAIWDIEKEIHALLNSENELEDEKLKKLRELNRERSRMLLAQRLEDTPLDEAKLKEIEAQIIATMKEAGASDEEINRQLETFRNTMPEFQTGTIDGRTKEGMAFLHSGESVINQGATSDLDKLFPGLIDSLNLSESARPLLDALATLSAAETNLALKKSEMGMIKGGDNYTTFNITQLPGEDGEALAKRISRHIQREFQGKGIMRNDL